MGSYATCFEWGCRFRLGEAFSAVLLLAPAVPWAQDYAAWAYHKEIYYDASATGAGLDGNVLDFPVLVRLTEADFPFAQARDSGQDLRFVKADGSPLDFEIDRYDSAARKAEIWVRIDTVKAGYRGHLARLYWGNPAAPRAGSQGGVFAGAGGFASVWHLRGRYPTPRANSRAGGQDAVPVNFDGDEQVDGIIGFADSLDGAASGDHLQTWEPFDDFSGGFTFSVWAYPTAVADFARFMDFGNGAGQDNLILSRLGSTDSLVFYAYHSASRTVLSTPGAIALNQWQHFAVTVAGKAAKLYRNGSLIASATLADTLRSVRRGNNYLGKSNWASNAYFAGRLDEVVVARAARSAGWIKLVYANQRAVQSLVTFTAPPACQARFAPPADTAVPEGGSLALEGAADCADRFHWTVVSGPAPRLLDPDVKRLELRVPRVAGDTVAEFRFSARYGDTDSESVVRVAIREAIPEPRFTLPARLAWNGKDTLLLEPVVENLASVRASPAPDLRYAWTLSGLEADTAWRSSGLMLASAAGAGALTVRLCLHNDGPEACAETAVTVESPTSLVLPGRSGAADSPGFRYRADGRRMEAADAGRGRPGLGRTTPGPARPSLIRR